jgi:hypothetical protein
MSLRIASTAALAGFFAVTLPAKAADPQLLNLVMPDAAVLAGVNVDQAKTSPFGQFVLNQVQTSDIQKLAAVTGFDPTRDVHEVLAAIGPAGSKTALALARGSFNPTQIAAAAALKGGTTTETYAGVDIIEDQKQTHGVAFLSSSLAVAGDVASVKAAIDRQKTPSSLPAAVLVQVGQWSNSQDAWVISTVPPATLHPAAGTAAIPGVGPAAAANPALQSIQSAAGGVKFGETVVVTAQATSDNAPDAESLANTLKLLAAVAQMQAQNHAGLQTLAKSLQVSSQGTAVNISFSISQAQIQELITQPHTDHRPARIERKM